MLKDIEKKIPEHFDTEDIFKRFHTEYTESMNTVLYQESIRYNKLLDIIKKSLKDLQLALAGKIAISDTLEKMSKSIFVNQVPLIWSDIFLSLKPLSSWIVDLNQRIKFFKDWSLAGKTPDVFWFSGFSFPQAFLTATAQNFARKEKIAIDLLKFRFEILDTITYKDIKAKPEHGVYVYGMFLEGARWNYDKHMLDDSLPKKLYDELPLVHIIPTVEKVLDKAVYPCPLYKVLSRAGTLLTTGHSTNYVLSVDLPIDRDEGEWVKAGVALFLALKQ
jgi:dynein heavy chain